MQIQKRIIQFGTVVWMLYTYIHFNDIFIYVDSVVKFSANTYIVNQRSGLIRMRIQRFGFFVFLS